MARRSVPDIPLRDVLRRSEEQVTLTPTETYREVTVKLWGKGVTLRRLASGGEIAGMRRFVVRAGQFILSRIDARNGACGIVPKELDGAVVSNDFPSFDANPQRLHVDYLRWMAKTARFVDLCRVASEGTTNRVRLQEDRFLKLAIPLPPLAEQRRVVARIEELVAKIEEARGLRRMTSEASDQLVATEAGRVFTGLAKDHEPVSFGSFNPHVTSGPRSWAARYVAKNERAYRFYRAQDIGPHGEVLSDAMVFIEPPGSDQGRTARLQTGDIFIVITGATVGRCSIFRNDFHPGYVSQHVAICRFPPGDVEPEYALKYLLSPEGQRQLIGQRYGQGKPGLNLSNLRGIHMPVPPLRQQSAVVDYLDKLGRMTDLARALQSDAATKLDALLPSILDKAFKGEL